MSNGVCNAHIWLTVSLGDCDGHVAARLVLPPDGLGHLPIVIGDEAKAMQISAKLQEQGILIPAIRYPTVAKGQARLRASLMATHTHEQLQTAATVIAQAVKECV